MSSPSSCPRGPSRKSKHSLGSGNKLAVIFTDPQIIPLTSLGVRVNSRPGERKALPCGREGLNAESFFRTSMPSSTEAGGSVWFVPSQDLYSDGGQVASGGGKTKPSGIRTSSMIDPSVGSVSI